MRPWRANGPIIVLAADITRERVNKLIMLDPRPSTLKRLRRELETHGFPVPPGSQPGGQ
ncbi:hypothetical protein GCM10010191_88780 [Actinomadura vinacea]|uniref:Uncharacterized protein n=1 Tax=Actinomadura vinacea TaxID=115336 RepID=A0ABN3KCE5_9ACTN